MADGDNRDDIAGGSRRFVVSLWWRGGTTTHVGTLPQGSAVVSGPPFQFGIPSGGLARPTAACSDTLVETSIGRPVTCK